MRAIKRSSRPHWHFLIFCGTALRLCGAIRHQTNEKADCDLTCISSRISELHHRALSSLYSKFHYQIFHDGRSTVKFSGYLGIAGTQRQAAMTQTKRPREQKFSRFVVVCSFHT